MTPGPRFWADARCNVLPVADLPAHLARAMRQVVGVTVPLHLRGEKRATHLMREVCAEADREGYALIVHPMPFGETRPMDADALEAWYARLGFKRFQDAPIVLMVRMARTH